MKSSKGEHSSGAGWAVSRQATRSVPKLPSSPAGALMASAYSLKTLKSPRCLLGEPPNLIKVSPPPALTCAQGRAVSLHWHGWRGTARRGSLTSGSVQPQRAGPAA